MPRRAVLTSAEREELLALPTDEATQLRFYSLDSQDIEHIQGRRGDDNRLGFAVQLCYFRYPGFSLGEEVTPPHWLLCQLGEQLGVDPICWLDYSRRSTTRREHVVELQSIYGFVSFTRAHAARIVEELESLAVTTDRGFVVASALVKRLREQQILLPPLRRIELLCSEAITRGWRQIYQRLTEELNPAMGQGLEGWPTTLSETQGESIGTGRSRGLTGIRWLYQPPGSPHSRNVLEHLARLKAVESVAIPEATAHSVPQHRLSQLARQGATMSAQDLAKLETLRRQATLVAMAVELRATLIDEIIDLHDRILGAAWNRAKRDHEEQMGQNNRELRDQVRLYAQIGARLVEAREQDRNAFDAIEAVLPWDEFVQSVQEAKAIERKNPTDFLPRLSESYTSIHRYAPALLEALCLTATPATQDLMEGVETLRSLYRRGARKVPIQAPTSWIPKRWQSVIGGFASSGGSAKEKDLKFYELCLWSELKNAIRSGDVWVKGSRQFKEFDAYLLSPDEAKSRLEKAHIERGGAAPLLPLETEATQFFPQKLALLKEQLKAVEKLAKRGELPDASIEANGLKLTPLKDVVPEAAGQLLQSATALLPRIKITDLLLEVEAWTGFSTHFTHLKSQAPTDDIDLLLCAILADGLNLGLTKMAAASPDLSPSRLNWLYSWHIRDETYALALAELVNAQSRQPLAAFWGEGTTSSSDGQRFRAASQGAASGQWNPKYGAEPGRLFYTHVSDQYAPFHSQVINTNVRDATYVLDGLLHHESDLKIEEHYTDTAGFTDHVFALMHLLGFKFAPRIRDLADKRLYLPPGYRPDTLAPLCAGPINLNLVQTQWEEMVRLALSISQGTVSASLMLRKLGAYPRQNALASALRELGRIERTLFTLEWLQDTNLRRRVQIGLNKGEARNALARAVFFHRLGEIRDRSFGNQRHRASGLTLLTAAITLWNTVYLQRALDALRQKGHTVDPTLLPHLSPLGWEHINLTGDYSWNRQKTPKQGQFRPLRSPATP